MPACHRQIDPVMLIGPHMLANFGACLDRILLKPNGFTNGPALVTYFTKPRVGNLEGVRGHAKTVV